ncbi:MAG TPA: hypothetical protein VF981_12320 [Gemmatimonadaceae bacterium]
MWNSRIARLFGVVPLLVVGPASAAQAQNGLSVWGGIGKSAQSGATTVGTSAAQLGVQLAIPLVPIAARAELLALGNDFSTDRLSYSVNAVARMPLPLVQPYAIAGRGTYKLAPGVKETGWNTGVGVRVGLLRVGVFAEVRRHHPIRRTITSIGVTF